MLELLDRRWGECRLCKILRNPYYAPAAYLARLAVNFATMMWSVIILCFGETIGSRLYIYHQQMLYLMPLEMWAVLVFLASGFGIYRLFHRSCPAWWGAVGYWLLMMFWVYVDAAIVLVDRDLMSPIGLASITSIAMLSIYAAASHSSRDALR